MALFLLSAVPWVTKLAHLLCSIFRKWGRWLPEMAEKITPISHVLLQWTLSLLPSWAGPEPCCEQQNAAEGRPGNFQASTWKIQFSLS